MQANDQLKSLKALVISSEDEKNLSKQVTVQKVSDAVHQRQIEAVQGIKRHHKKLEARKENLF